MFLKPPFYINESLLFQIILLILFQIVFICINVADMTDVLSKVLRGQAVSLNSNEVMQLGAKCSSEGYTLEKLFQIAKTLFKSDTESCFKFLQYVQKHQITRNIYRDFIHQPHKLQIYYSLAALALSKALRQSDKIGIEKWQKQFNKYMNEGSKVKTSAEKLNQLLHGFNSYYLGDFNKSINNFNRLDNFDNKQSAMSTIALLGLAQSYFMIRKYDKALEFYKKVLISNRNLPTKARLGMAYCFYQLEKYQLAQKCFQRILALDPKCAEAYLGLACLSNRKNDIQGYFANLKKAHELKPEDPLVILHLSEHFLFKGEYQKCERGSRKGLQLIQTLPKFLKKDIPNRDDYQILKARFNNLIGQVHHIKNQYDEARKYYSLAKQRGLKFNELGLAQTYLQTGSFKQAIKIFEYLFSSPKISQIKIVAQFNKTFAYCLAKAPMIKLQNEQKDTNYYFKQSLKYNRYDYDALIDYSVFLNEINDKKQTLKTLTSALQSIISQGVEPKPELLNNLSVSHAEQKNYDQALSVINSAIENLTKVGINKSSQQQQIKYHGLYLTVQFNKAIILEYNHYYHEAMEIHRALINYNKYYVDSYVRLADILYTIGQKANALALLESAFVQCTKSKFPEVRVDKLITMKSYLQLAEGAINQAKQTFRRLGPSKFVYDQLFQMSIGYENIIRKQLQKPIIRQFLHQSREKCIILCNTDQFNVFSYMILCILFLTDFKITKEQGILYFNQLKIAEIQFPIVHFNFGVFSLIHEDYQNAISCFNRFKQRTKSNKGDEYLSLTYFLKGDYVQCLNSIKRNMISEPNNLKYRFQFAYANEKRIQKLYEQENNFKDLKLSTKYLTTCKKIYESLARISSIEHVKSVDTPELKQKLRSEIGKIRLSSDDRDKFVQNQITYYGQKQKQIIQKEKRIQQEQRQRLEQFRKAKQGQKLLNQFMDDDDESSTQKIKRKKREKFLQQQRIQNQQAKQRWKAHQQQQRQLKLLNEQQGRKRKRNNQNKKQKKQKKFKVQEEEYQSEEQFRDRDDHNSQPNEYQSEQQDRKKKKKKKNKNKDRERERERNRSGSDDNEDKKKKKKRKKQRKERQQGQQNSSKNDQEGPQSEKGSNPFDDDEQQSNKSQEELRKRQEPQKKNPKRDKDDDDNIDINDYIIQ